MELAVGAMLEGKVTGLRIWRVRVVDGIGKSGLVHISEVANTYVSDIKDHQVGRAASQG
jgi:S1 RNA binding domain protein